MLAELCERLVARGMTLPQSLAERAGTGDLISRSSDDVAQIADTAPQMIPTLAATGFTIVVTLARMTAIGPWYGLALAVILPVYVVERTAMSARDQ